MPSLPHMLSLPMCILSDKGCFHHVYNPVGYSWPSHYCELDAEVQAKRLQRAVLCFFFALTYPSFLINSYLDCINYIHCINSYINCSQEISQEVCR